MTRDELSALPPNFLVGRGLEMELPELFKREIWGVSGLASTLREGGRPERPWAVPAPGPQPRASAPCLALCLAPVGRAFPVSVGMRSKDLLSVGQIVDW